MINRDDLFRDKFRTGDTPLSGGVFYRLSLPNAEWFWAQVADTLLAMTIPDNWEKVGIITVDEATEAASEVLMSFQSMCGAIFPVAWAAIPDGFLVCDGATYLRVDYPYLYDVLDAVFLVDADHFKVPDLRDNVPVGTGGTFAMGDTGGETEHTLTQAEMPSHSHSTGNSVTILAIAPGEAPVLAPNPIPAATGNTGGGGPHNNMQPYIGLAYVICAR